MWRSFRPLTGVECFRHQYHDVRFREVLVPLRGVDRVVNPLKSPLRIATSFRPLAGGVDCFLDAAAGSAGGKRVSAPSRVVKYFFAGA